jgi:hypothetical protein
MNKMIRLLLLLLAFPLVASAQFQFADRLPNSTSTTESHGLAVDNDGNVWNGIYNSRLVNEGTERRNIVAVFDSEGNELPFSPIHGVEIDGAFVRFGPITGVSKSQDGNIYVSVHGFRTTAAPTDAAPNPIIGNVWNQTKGYIYVLDATDGSFIERADVTYMRTETAAHAPNRAAVTDDGFVAVSFVFPASPIVILDPNDDWNVLNTITSDKTGFSRTIEVSADGNKVFNPNTEPFVAGGAPGHIQVWEGEVFGEYAIGTPVAVGTDPGAIARYPNTDLLFFSGGGSGNAELGGTLFKGDRFYGVNMNNGAVVTTFDWDRAEGEAYRTPRAMAFSDDGQTVYVGTFTPAVGGVQKFSLEGELNADVVSVRFMVNTATIPDTVKTNDLVQIRGAVKTAGASDYAEQNNYFGQNINWGSTSVRLQNAGGDYWTANLTMAPGDELKYKIYTAKSVDGEMRDHTGGGWESVDDQFYTVAADAQGTIDLPVIFFNRSNPIEAREDSIGLFFRVNVGSQVATGIITDNTKVGVRGTPSVMRNPDDWSSSSLHLAREASPDGARNIFYSGTHYVPVDQAGTEFAYKFVIENEGQETVWESTPDRPSKVGQADSTLYYGFFSDRRPPTADVVQASLQFAVNVGVLEGLGFFNPAIDQVFVPGGFNGWDTQNTPSTFSSAVDAWTSAVQIREEVGANVEYKYFIRWAASRFEEGSADYIEGLVSGNGWEEPGITGGGNRVYTYTNETEQVVDDFGSGVAYFNGIPPQGVIRETLGGETTMPVTFKVDMSAALTHSVPFNPATDKAYVMFETPFFGLTQGLPIGDNQPIFAEGNEDALARVELTPVDGEPNMYSMTLDMSLPTENHLGFTLFYVNPEGVRTGNGSGFSAGRRYYRYIQPLDSSDPNAIIWPDSYEVAMIQWKAPTTLDFETPPNYGLGTSIDDGRFETPSSFALFNNYPNPFNPSTNISFNLPSSEFVELNVFNVLGQRVATVLSQQMTAGTHTVAFNARNLASGVYIYQIRAGSFVQNKTMMLVK